MREKRMKRKPVKRAKLSLESHKRMGTAMKTAVAEIWALPHEERFRGPHRKLYQRALDGLDKARCAMDSVLAEDYPEISNQEFFSVYYRGVDSGHKED
jgi:hypothetical protein